MIDAKYDCMDGEKFDLNKHEIILAIKLFGTSLENSKAEIYLQTPDKSLIFSFDTSEISDLGNSPLTREDL